MEYDYLYWQNYFSSRSNRYSYYNSHNNTDYLRSPECLCRELQPVVDYGICQTQCEGLETTMMGVAVVSYLMGKGYDCNTAQEVFAHWERNRIPDQ